MNSIVGMGYYAGSSAGGIRVFNNVSSMGELVVMLSIRSEPQSGQRWVQGRVCRPQV